MRRYPHLSALGALLPFVNLALPAGSLGAQTVSPPIAEYQERARSSFQLINGTLFPLNAVLEVRGFRVTEQGEVIDAPLDTTKVQVKLSAMSFRIPPRGTYTVFYEARADSVPAWFNVLSALSGARTESGLSVRILLPHVVYLNQKQALGKAQVTVRGFELDASRGRLRVQLENTGPNLGRVIEVTASNGELKSEPGPGFPLFPHSRRWTELAWSHATSPDHLSIRFAKFTLDTLLSPTATPSVPVDTAIMAQSGSAPAR